MTLATIAIVKDALDLLKKITTLTSSAEIKGILIEAQTKIIEVQEAHMATLEKCRELETALAAHDNWEREFARYKMISVFGGCFVFALKKELAGDDPPHWICPKCKNRRMVTPLQAKGRDWYCPECDFTLAQRGDSKVGYV